MLKTLAEETMGKHWSLAFNLLPAAALTFFSCAVSADAAPCREELVVGQTVEEIEANCGTPTLRDHRDVWEEVTEQQSKTRRTGTYDQWTYDTSSQELMLDLVFWDGRLTEIRSMGYGSPRDPLMPQCRNGEALAVGDSMVDAYLKCGEPLANEKQAEKVAETEEGEVTRRRSVAVVDWTYRYGPGVPGYTLRFEDGAAVEVRPRKFGK